MRVAGFWPASRVRDRTSHDVGQARRWFEQGARSRAEQQAPLQPVEQTVLPHSRVSPRQCGARRRGPETRRRSRRGSGPSACRAGRRSGSEKPRAGSSICGDETPRSRRTPCTCSMPRAGEHRRQVGEAGVLDREARVVGEVASARARSATASGSRSIAIRQPGDDSRSRIAARVAAAAEGAVDVEAVGRRDERFDRLVQEDGDVLRGSAWRASEAEVLQRLGHRRLHHRGLVRGVALARPRARSGCPCRAASRRAPGPAEARSSGAISTRDEASMSTSIALPRKIRFQPLESIGKAATLSRNVSHAGRGKIEQRAFRMLGDGELVDSHRRQQFAVAGRHRDAALAVERQRCGALEYDVRHKIPLKCTLRHFSGALAQGQLTERNKNQWNQGLRRDSETDRRARINVPKNKDLQHLLKDDAHQ